MFFVPSEEYPFDESPLGDMGASYLLVGMVAKPTFKLDNSNPHLRLRIEDESAMHHASHA